MITDVLDLRRDLYAAEVERLVDRLRRRDAALADARQRIATLEERLWRDRLTALWTRAWLVDHWAGLDVRALLLLDLDGFKQVNDAYGHAAGDQVLAEIGRRLSGWPDAIGVRLHGDELVVLAGAGPAVGGLVRRVHDLVAAPIDLGGVTVRMSASVGSARVGPGEPLAAVLGRADRAMYQAKRGRALSPIPGGGRRAVRDTARRTP